MDLEDGARIWVEDPEQVWLPGEVSGSELIVNGEPRECRGRLLRRSAEDAQGLEDLTDLPELHEAEVLQALDSRFAAGSIYTLTGPVLLAVNPFRLIPGLYSPEAMQACASKEKLVAHVFSLANHAYQGIRQRGRSQTVLISGESGAGKTETTKFVMQFLALAGLEQTLSVASDTRSVGPSPSQSLSHIERKVLGSNALLEAFGNAKTLRNENSSRFGKYTELQFGVESRFLPPRLAGVRIRTYLLEKVRVVEQKDGERSFHIFYQALAAARQAVPQRARTVSALSDGSGPGAPDQLDFSTLYGYPASSFNFIANSAKVSLTHGDDAENFESTWAAMRTIGMTSCDVSELLRSMAAVLFLGQLEFRAPDSESSALEPDPELCQLLGVEADDLQRALCKRLVQAAGERALANNTARQAAESRDALARHLYQALFDHVVTETSRSVGFQPECSTFCGVLDIFGFEFFEHNSFEQLCINFTNELLQQFFNSFIFENETALYRDEGVSWEPQDFPNNAPIVELLSKNPTGIFPRLDEECFVVNGSSRSWRSKLIAAHDSHRNFSYVKYQHETFVVEHFAGLVTYTVDGFLEKNRDRLSPDLLTCMCASSRPFIRACFGAEESNGARDADGKSRSISKSVKSRSCVSSEFRNQLQELMEQIRKTEPHFVRCIKPNHECQPYEDPAAPQLVPLFKRRLVAEQLTYQGVLEAIRVSRAGYPVRFLHADFFADFRSLLSAATRSDLEASLQSSDASAAVRSMLAEPPFNSLLGRSWAHGRTRIFLKQEQYGRLKLEQSRLRSSAATLIQARQRGLVARSMASGRWRALRTLQAHARGWRTRRAVQELRRSGAARMLQAALRTALRRAELRSLTGLAVRLQALARMRPRRSRFRVLSSCVQRIQRWRRGLVQRRRFRNLPVSTLKLQSAWRGFRGRRMARDRRLAIIRLRAALRVLLRSRRRNARHRAWRHKVLRDYRARTPVPAPSEDVLMQQYISLEKRLRQRLDEVARLRSEVDSLEVKVADAKRNAWI